MIVINVFTHFSAIGLQHSVQRGPVWDRNIEWKVISQGVQQILDWLIIKQFTFMNHFLKPINDG